MKLEGKGMCVRGDINFSERVKKVPWIMRGVGETKNDRCWVT